MSKLASEEISNIFDELPVAHAVIKPESPTFPILYANNAYCELFNVSAEEILGNPFSEIDSDYIHREENTENATTIDIIKKVAQENEVSKTEIVPLKGARTNSTRYCIFSHSTVQTEGGNIKYIIQSIEDVTNTLSSQEIRQAQTKKLSSRTQLHVRNADLQDQVSKKIAQYKAARKELNDFMYSVSHDLRAPLRRIDGFSQELINEYEDQLDETGAHFLRRVRQGARDMGNLIDDLLKLSRVSRRQVELASVNLSEIAQTVYNELIELNAERKIDFKVEPDLITEADEGLTKVMLSNLISNALKFTSKKEQATIEMGKTRHNGTFYFYIKDNGVGFDPQYADKLFKAFDRLHSQKEFKGSGIGLATVKRIVNLHGGTIWADGKLDSGATFYFNFQRGN